MVWPIKAVLFDVFGTTVDWLGGLTAGFAEVGALRKVAGPWEPMALRWHQLYSEAVSEVRTGQRPWEDFEAILHESLDRLLDEHGLSGLDRAARAHLVLTWRRFPAWEDAGPGLMRTKRGFIIAPLSNGHVAMLIEIARHAGLPWDAVFSAELFGQYKTHPHVYAGACALLRLQAQQVMLVASHPPDLDAARGAGLRTAYVRRPREFGTAASEPPPRPDADIIVSDFIELAKELGV